MAKRTVATIKQYDYTSKEEFLKDIPKMLEKGYTLVDNGMINDCLKHGEIVGDDDGKWKYTAYFLKSPMM